MEASPDYYFNSIDSKIKCLFSRKNIWEAINKKIDFEPEIKGKNEDSRIGDSFVGKGSVVNNSVVEDEVYIGENCVIGPHAFIREGTIILNNSHIGRAEIKNSIIMEGVHAHHMCHILDSIIGVNCNIAAQFTTANLRFDGNNIVICGKDTGMRKFGVILGDNCKTGIFSHTMPGTLIGPDSILYPGKTAKGFYSKNSKIK